MIISKGRAYIFVHIPKTGGTSLAHALEARAMRDDILIGDTPKAKRRKNRVKNLSAQGRLWKHSSLADIEGVVSQEEMAKMFTFTLVRNPWDRMVSYYHWLRAQSFVHPDVAFAKALTFEGFLREPLVYTRLSASSARVYMTNSGGKELCNCYIRLEHFEQDALPLFDHLGFQLSLPHVNKSYRDRNYRTYYSSRACDIVAEMCSEDIARFDYRFGDTSEA